MAWTLVTGGARRLGAEICKTLAEQHHDIIVHYKSSKQDAEDVASSCCSRGVKAEIIQGDFSSYESTERFVKEIRERFSTVSHLINNVGNYENGLVSQTLPHHWNALFQVNLHATQTIIQGLLPTIIQSQGCIVNIGVAGIESMRVAKSCGVYSMTKIGLLAFTRALAFELASHNVTVNMVSPGQMEISVNKPEPNALPMRRFGTQNEVAKVIAFLLNKENHYITGQNIEIAGGYAL